MYGTVEGADDYHAQRGNEFTSDMKEELLLRASEYIDRYRLRFPGSKTGGRSQVREWPRKGAVDLNGELIAEDEIPNEVVAATYEAALLLSKGVSLDNSPVSGSSVGVVTRKKVKAGPVETETEYDTKSRSSQSYSTISETLAPVLSERVMGASVEILRI